MDFMKKLIAILLVLVIVFSLTACFGTGKNKSEINIYFKNAQTSELTIEKVKYTLSQNTVDMANFAMDALKNGPTESGNAATIPETSVFSEVVVKDELATVDFKGYFTNYTGVDEIVARFSVVRTLCDIPGISGVLITVDGKPLVSNTTGKEIGVLRKKDIVHENIENVNQNTTETTLVKLYFATSDAMALKVEERKVETQDTVSIEKTIVNELIKGPTSPELISVIPTGTKVISVDTKESVCYVNLSKEFVSKFAGGSGKLALYSIINSLCSLESITSVQFLIEGDTNVEFGDYVFIEPYTADMDIVQTK